MKTAQGSNRSRHPGLLADDLDRLQLAEELEQQGAILEELQRLLALQAEEEKLTEMLAALHDEDGVPAPLQSQHLSCYSSVLN